MRIVVVALLALLSAPASAAAKWSEGEPLYTQGFNCTSIIFNQPRLELQTFSYASQEVPDDGTPPYAGDPFFLKVSFGSIGDICGGGGSALPEFVLPAGVERAPGEPYWTVYENEREQRGGDPVEMGRGLNGGILASVRDKRDGKAKPWPYANSGGFISVHIPVRARQKLNGIGTAAPSCPQRDNGAACPDDQVGDYVQVVTQVADGGAPGTLVPFLGLFAREPRAPTVSVPKRPRARGFTVSVKTTPGFKARAVLGRKAVSGKADAKGVAKLKLRGRRGKATLKVQAIADDGAISADTATALRLR